MQRILEGAPAAPPPVQAAPHAPQVKPFRPITPKTTPDLGAVMIYSVNPFPIRLMNGTLGNRMVPACPKGEQWVGLEIPDKVVQKYDGDLDSKGNNKYTPHVVLADSIVGDFLGRYRHLGIFAVPEGVSIEDQADKARLTLKKTWLQWFNKAELLWQEKKVRGRIPALSHQACEGLGLSAPWHEEPATTSLAPCPFCGAMIEAGNAKCRTCGEVLDAKALSSRREKAKAQGGVWAGAPREEPPAADEQG